MQGFLEGIRTFENEIYPRRREEFARLARGQSPRALFITCSDSRVDPALLTGAEPGDLFVLRNAGNIVPRFGASESEAGTIEFAVRAVGVRHIVVCGHTCCAAVAGIIHPDKVSELPSAKRWLRHAGTQLDDFPHASPAAMPPVAAIERHVRTQLSNLQTHPAVREALENDSIELHGWMFHIERGRVTVFSREEAAFVAADEAYGAALA